MTKRKTKTAPPSSKKAAKTSGKAVPKRNAPVKKAMFFKGKDALRKELQRAVAFRCYEALFAEGHTKDYKRLLKDVEELFLGTKPDAFSMVDKCAKGEEAFALMYEPNYDDDSSRLLLKKDLQPMDPETDIVASMNSSNGGINPQTLTAKSKRNLAAISERAIWEMAKEVEKNGRKMQAIISKSPYKDMNTLSGDQWIDYLKYCRYSFMMAMGVEAQENAAPIEIEDDDEEEDDVGSQSSKSPSKGTNDSPTGSGVYEINLGTGEKRKIVDDDDQRKPPAMVGPAEGEEEEDDDEDDKEEPALDIHSEKLKTWNGHWFFNGFIAWALWGHIPPPGGEVWKAKAFMTKDEPNNNGGIRNKADGRAASRKETTAKESKDRSSAPVAKGRGVGRRDAILQKMADDSTSFNHMLHCSLEYQADVSVLREKMKVLERKRKDISADLAQVSPFVMSHKDLWEDIEENRKKFPPFDDYVNLRAEKLAVMNKMSEYTTLMNSLNEKRRWEVLSAGKPEEEEKDEEEFFTDTEE